MTDTKGVVSPGSRALFGTVGPADVPKPGAVGAVSAAEGHEWVPPAGAPQASARISAVPSARPPAAPKEYMIRGVGMNRWGMAQFQETSPDAYAVRMKWSDFEFSFQGDPAHPEGLVQHSTTEVKGTARRLKDDHLELALDMPTTWLAKLLGGRSMQKFILAPQSDGSYRGSLRDGVPFFLKPPDWGPQLDAQEVESMFAARGTIVDSTMTPVPERVVAEAAFLGRDPSGTSSIDKQTNLLKDLGLLKLIGGGPTRYRVNRGTVTVDEDGKRREVRFFYFAAEGKQPRPLVMINPILSGTYSLEELQARYLAGHGISTVIVERPRAWIDPSLPVEALEDVIEQTIRDQRYVLRHLSSLPEVDASKLGTAGWCTGGTDALLLHAVEPNIKASYPALASGDLPDVLLGTGASSAQKLVEANVPGLNAGAPTQEERARRSEPFRAKMKQVLRADPLRLRGSFQPGEPSSRGYGNVKMAIAGSDTYVPVMDQMEAWTGLGQPPLDVYANTDHFGFARHWFLVMPDMVQFFEKQFGIAK